MKQKKKIILLAGPTASGKSKLSIMIAKFFGGEIINADSMQIYKEINILTSKPTAKDKKLVKHHLYGFNSVEKEFSTGHWLDKATKNIKLQWAKGKIPIVVGGTGLYFKALIDGLVKIPEISKSVKKDVRKLHKKIGQKRFYKKLIKIDPFAKTMILPTDSQRSIRAYEVKKFNKKSIFNFMKDTKSNFDKDVFIKIFINAPKEILHKKINERVESMFNQGAVKEVKKFLKMKINKDLPPNKIIGMREIREFLEEKASLSETKELIKLRTRQYAKRQFTWARGHMKSWEMLYSSDLNDLYRKVINKIS